MNEFTDDVSACAIVIDPAPFVIVIPAPAVNVAFAYPPPLPINSWPSVGALLSPVPPLAIATVPNAPEILILVSRLPSPTKLFAVTVPVKLPVTAAIPLLILTR